MFFIYYIMHEYHIIHIIIMPLGDKQKNGQRIIAMVDSTGPIIPSTVRTGAAFHLPERYNIFRA